MKNECNLFAISFAPRRKEELLQDVFLRLWEKREKLNIEVSFKSYLLRVAHNLVMDMFRRAAFDRKLLDHLITGAMGSYAATDERTLVKEAEALLSEAIDLLPPQRKKVYLLCKNEGKSYNEVSQLLGISPSTVSDHMVKAAKSVKEHFSGNDFTLLALMALSIAEKFNN